MTQKNFTDKFPAVCFSLVVVQGVLALAGWILDEPIISSFYREWIPMAPSTAVLFIPLSLTMLIKGVWPDKKTVRILAMAIITFTALIALLVLVLTVNGIYLAIEHIGFSAKESEGNSPVGHMSPITAIGFILVSISFFIWVFAPPESSVWHLTMFFVGLALLAFVVIFLLAYVIGDPFLYTVTTIPPAASTLLDFLLLGTGLLLVSGRHLYDTYEIYKLISLRNTFFLIAGFLLFSVALFIIGYFYFSRYEREFQRNIEAELETITHLKANQLSRYLQEQRNHAVALEKNIYLRSSLDPFSSDMFDKPLPDDLLDLLFLYQETFNYHRIMILDTSGALIAEVPSAWKNVPGAILSRLPEVLRSGEITLVDMFEDAATDSVCLAFLLPLHVPGDTLRITSVLGLVINPNREIFPLTSAWPSQNFSAESILVRKDSNIAVVLTSLLKHNIAPLQLRMPLECKHMVASLAVEGTQGMMIGTDFQGLMVQAFAAQVAGSPWCLITRVDLVELYSPIWTHFWNMVAMISVLLALGATTFGLIWRNQRVSFYKKQLITDQAVHENEQKFSKIFHKIPMIMSISSLENGIYLDVNDEFLNVSGFSRDEVIGKSSLELNLLQPVQRKNYISELKLKGEIKSLELDFTMRDQRVVTCLVNTQVIELKGIPTMLTSAQDISERKRMENALRISEQQFREFFENESNYCFKISHEGIILDVNPSALARFGYPTKEDLVGKPVITTIYASRCQDKAREVFTKWKETGKISNELLTIRTASGEEREVLLNVNAIVDTNGNLIHSVSIQTDITEMKRAQEKLKTEMARLEIMNDQMVDRELIMIELKKEIGRLKDELKGNR